jgi:predicted dehydrogenase
MRVLFTGLGSIALKHLAALKVIDPNIEVLALRTNVNSNIVDGVTNIYSIENIPRDIDFILITNPTSMHAQTIEELLPFACPIFIEKPVVNNSSEGDILIQKIQDAAIMTYVACNLRFHPAIQYLKEEFEIRKPIEFSAYCGSYLPNWRPNRDYRENYSSKAEMGGGVHLDLIHELDYCYFLMGKPSRIHSSYLRKKSDLEINSIDVANYVVEYPSTSVFISLNYYRKSPKRSIDIVWDDDVWSVDLIKNTIVNSGGKIIFSSEYIPSDTYLNQLKYFINCIDSGIQPMNSFSEGLEILKSALHEQ